MQFCAYGQASLRFVKQLFILMKRFEVKVFASMIPKGSHLKPHGIPDIYIRRDLTFLFQRYHYFLEDHRSIGTIVFDETDRTDDRRFLRQIERFFMYHERGKHYAKRIVPTPFFIGSDMSYPLQAADIVCYCLGQGHRRLNVGLNAPVRQEITALIDPKDLNDMICQFDKQTGDGEPFKPYSVFYVEKPWEIAGVEKVSQTGVVFQAPQKTNLQ